MSNLLDTLLAAGQQMQARRAAAPPPPPVHATRADRLIAEGDAKRVAYRRDNPTADSAMALSAQIGFLHAQLRLLDGMLAGFEPKYRHDVYLYTELYVPELGGQVVCGYTVDPGQPGVAPSVCLEEVWVNGRDVSQGIAEDLAQQLIDRLLASELEGGQ